MKKWGTRAILLGLAVLFLRPWHGENLLMMVGFSILGGIVLGALFLWLKLLKWMWEKA